MSDNSHYWSNKQSLSDIAMEHHKRMETDYSQEILYSADKSRIYSPNSLAGFDSQGKDKPNTYLLACDTVSAAFTCAYGKTAILNFASYKDPGGFFIEGSKAQEECLCHASTLYEVLIRHKDYYERNKEHLNRALYSDRAIYSPDILFENPKDNTVKRFDVITCAAPNASCYLRYNTDVRKLDAAIESRVKFIKDIAEANEVQTIILGAFGCGVFGLNPLQIAETFKKHFSNTTIKNVVYAIIDENSVNYQIFSKVFADTDGCTAENTDDKKTVDESLFA